MTGPVPDKLRPHLWGRSQHLHGVAQNLWRVSLDIHNRQNRAGDPSEYGRIHVEYVEYNIWRLLFDPSNPAKLVHDNGQNFGPYDIFLLSAAACCHDFDKAHELPTGVAHGEYSSEIVRNNTGLFGLNDNQAEDIGAVISIHGIDDAEVFKGELKRLSTERQCDDGTFNLQRLAVLLRAADVLHLDRSRISSIVKATTDWQHLPPPNRQKCFFRSHTRGWGIRGRVIHIESSVGSDIRGHASRLQKSFDWIRRNEWSAVAEHLQAYGFAYQLDLDLLDARSGERVRAEARKYIPVKAKRYVQKDQATDFLRIALEQDAEYRLCRNGYTSHATGTAIARMCVQVMVEKMENVTTNFVTDVNEFALESECVFAKLCEHIARFSNTQSLLRQFAGDDGSSGPHGNLLVRALRTLPEGDRFLGEMRDLRAEFGKHIEDMRLRVARQSPRLESLPDEEQREAAGSASWFKEGDPDAPNWFRQKKLDLAELCEALAASFAALRAMLKPIKDDWSKDVNLIEQQEGGMHSAFAAARNG